MEGFSGEAFSSEIWDWALDQIPQIAAKFRVIDADDLSGEMRVLLLRLRYQPAPHVRDWKSYIATCLLHRASRLARQWRKVGALESRLEIVNATASEPALLDVAEPGRGIFRMGRLGNSDRRLLKQLASCNDNVSRLARHLGRHRNTIHRRLREIRRTRSLFEIESAPLAPGPPTSLQRSQLEALIRKPDLSVRDALRVRLILDLLDGLAYHEIVRRYGTSASTIARWRARFEKKGIAGLAARHPGRKPSRRSRRTRGHGLK